MPQLRKLIATEDTDGVVERYHTMKKRDREMLCTMLNDAPSSFVESVISHPMIDDTEWGSFIYAKHPLLAAQYFFQKEKDYREKEMFLNMLRNIGSMEAVDVALTTWCQSPSHPHQRDLFELISDDLINEKFGMAETMLKHCHKPNDPFLLYKVCQLHTNNKDRMKNALEFLVSRFVYQAEDTQTVFEMMMGHHNMVAQDFLFRLAPNKSQNALALLNLELFPLLDKVIDDVPEPEQRLIIKKLLKMGSAKNLQKHYSRIFSFYLKHQMIDQLPQKPTSTPRKM